VPCREKQLGLCDPAFRKLLQDSFAEGQTQTATSALICGCGS
jgi:hypothetical protein